MALKDAIFHDSNKDFQLETDALLWYPSNKAVVFLTRIPGPKA